MIIPRTLQLPLIPGDREDYQLEQPDNTLPLTHLTPRLPVPKESQYELPKVLAQRVLTLRIDDLL